MTAPFRREDNQNEHHKPELDGVRGIAILAVLLSHGITTLELMPHTMAGTMLSGMLTPGWSGVDLFFVLSGFLITGILLRTKESANYFESFYMRRVLRIFPIYYTVITVLFVAGCVPQLKSVIGHHALPVGRMDHISYYLYLQNWPIFRPHGMLVGELTGPYWTLALEEQFYLLWPLLIYWLSRRALLRLCVAGLVLGLPLRILANLYYPHQFTPMMITPLRMDGLLIGAICALVMFERKQPLPMAWIKAMLLAGAAIIIFIALRTHGHELVATDFWMQTFGVTGFSLLGGGLLAISQHRLPVLQRILTMRWLRSVGKYSYGMYIYHAILFAAIKLPLSRIIPPHGRLNAALALLVILGMIVVVYGVSKVSFDLFEVRFLRMKRHFRAAGHDS